RGISAAAGRRQADVDVGFAAQFAQVAVPFLFELALADGGACALARVLVRGGDLARAFALDDVPACRGPERRGDLAILQGRDLGAEVRAIAVLCEPSQRAAAVGAGLVLRILLGEFGEIGTAGDARTQGLDLGPGRSLAVLAGPDQDVARLELGHRDGRVAGPGPALDQLDQLEARGRAHRPEDLARLHAGDDPRERGRDLVDAAPAQVAAFQRVGAVGVAYRRGLEFDF